MSRTAFGLPPSRRSPLALLLEKAERSGLPKLLEDDSLRPKPLDEDSVRPVLEAVSLLDVKADWLRSALSPRPSPPRACSPSSGGRRSVSYTHLTLPTTERV